jgi:elongation factor P
MQFQYPDGDLYFFMNMESYEQVGIPIERLDGMELFLTDSIEVRVLIFKGAPVTIELPNFIEATVVECEPGVRGNTATGATKSATISTGATLQVPLFVEEGDRLKIDTREKKYVSRAGK